MRHSAALARFETIQPAPSEASVAALRERINEAINFIGALPADVIANAETHAFELSMPIVRGWIGGADYIFQLVLPDFFFHVSMAHAILRQLGAPIGKRDYLGALTITAGGYR
jgi:hypothetical protein